MKFKKTILVFLLLFSILSLFVILYFSKNRIGMFGRLYDAYIKETAETISIAVKNNLKKVNEEINALCEENIIKSIIEANALNLQPVLGTEILEIKNKIEDCKKIQLIDREGIVIFSTLENEALSQKIKSSIIEKLKQHFEASTLPFIYFVDNKEFVAIKPVNVIVSNSIYQGYVSVYYGTEKLLKNIPSKSLKIPFSSENFIFFSKGNVDTQDINTILQSYSRLEGLKKENLEKTIGAISQVDGIKIVYYAKNEKFISLWTILFLIVDLLLILLIVLTLLQIGKEEKLYKKISISELETETIQPKESEEIKTLVEEIEEDKTIEEKEARKGIEEILSEQPIDFTKNVEEIKPEVIGEIPSTQVEGEKLSIETYEEMKPSNEAILFAEEELLQTPSNEYIEQEKALEEKEEIQLETIPSEEISPIEEIKGEEILTEIEAPYAEETPLEFTKEEKMENEIETVEIPEIEEIELEEAKLEATEPEKEEISSVETSSQSITNVMRTPPEKISTIATVEDYGNVALDLCKNINITKIAILKKVDSHFIPIIQQGFKRSEISFDVNDPLINLFFSKGKCVEIKGNLNSKYLMEKIGEEDLKDLEELFIMPIVKKQEIVGVAFYGREIGKPEGSNLQKFELFNLGYLQETL